MRLAIAATLALLTAPLTTLTGSEARADGCYICTSGSGATCKDYCRYSGSDTFDSRKTCEKKGCKIGGTAACPTASNYKICQAVTPPPLGTAGAAPKGPGAAGPAGKPVPPARPAAATATH